ncbi:tryptophanyl-tRNA synthetase [Novymonas esmeraldas]|uniref:tryptophan--tRNA ligase n=1 Tax=Novymonas esmeraldas TaxID=1808958 RepID=A0AAW0ENV9_9TRYP
MRRLSSRVRSVRTGLSAALLREASGQSASGSNGGSSDGTAEDVITPWAVAAKGPQGINYDRVLTTFKAERVDDGVQQHMQDVIAKYHARAMSITSANVDDPATHLSTSPAAQQQQPPPPPPLHHFFTRGVAFSHRDLHKGLARIEDSIKPGEHAAYLYTGRGPSAGSMHVGHVLPFLLTKYLQDVFQLPLVIQITDDEKYLFRDVPFDGARAEEMIRDNIKDIIAFGFNPRRTFIFRNTHYMGEMYTTVLRLQRSMTANAVRHTLGISDSDNIGKFAFPATQAAPCFSSAFRRVLQNDSRPMQCIIPCAIDQDPFFVLTRAAAARLRLPPPTLLHTKFLPALKGLQHKMSSSAAEHGVITLHDTDKQVRQKLRRAFSGGRATLEEMQASGADLTVDVAYEYLRFFCHDDAAFADVTARYGSGAMNSGDVKDMAAECLLRDVLRDWRERRANVTDDDVVDFCGIRNILL